MSYKKPKQLKNVVERIIRGNVDLVIQKVKLQGKVIGYSVMHYPNYEGEFQPYFIENNNDWDTIAEAREAAEKFLKEQESIDDCEHTDHDDGICLTCGKDISADLTSAEIERLQEHLAEQGDYLREVNKSK